MKIATQIVTMMGNIRRVIIAWNGSYWYFGDEVPKRYMKKCLNLCKGVRVFKCETCDGTGD